jgi:Protein of unknown function (DUF2795)
VAYDTQRAAELQVLLEGAALPATRRELVDYALRQDEGWRFRSDLEALPQREYRSLDEVGEELVRIQPVRADRSRPLPRDESGEPPGGDDYTNPAPEPGGVRDDAPPDNPPEKALEQQTQTQQKQKQRQEQGG